MNFVHGCYEQFVSALVKNLNLLSRFLKCHNLESQFCELLRPQAPPFQKIERNPLNLVTFRQDSS